MRNNIVALGAGVLIAIPLSMLIAIQLVAGEVQHEQPKAIKPIIYDKTMPTWPLSEYGLQGTFNPQEAQ